MQKKESAAAKAEQQVAAQALLTRLGIVASLLILGLIWVSSELYQLQVKEAKHWAAEGVKVRRNKQTLEAPRGSIYDRDLNLLAHERQVNEIVADTKMLKDPTQVVPRLAKALNQRQAQILSSMSEEQILASYRKYLAQLFASRLGLSEADMERRMQRLTKEDRLASVLATDLETAAFRQWQEDLDRPDVMGLVARSHGKRVYPQEQSLVQVMGSVSHEGKAVDGSAVMEKAAAGGSFLAGYSDYERQPAKPGNSVVLTMDLKLQQMVEQKLKTYFAQYSPRSLCCALVEPSSGSILSMASEPVYQPLPGGGQYPKNLCMAHILEPGSTMKISTVAGALDTGAVNLGQSFYCHQGLYKIPETGVWVDDDTPHETLSVAGIFINSSNIGTYKIAREMGAERLYEYAQRFGFGVKTGLPLPGQQGGILNPLAKWSAFSLRSLAMGYEIEATPLQVAMMAAAIANGGVLMTPRMVSHIAHPDGTLHEVKPQAVRQACSAATARKMRQLMEGVVTEGSGKLAAIEGVRVAGKTGTAQMLIKTADGKRAHNANHRAVWFVGFVPADKPQFACVVMAEDPQLEDKSLLYGGKFAAPIFADIASAALGIIATRETPPAMTAGVIGKP
jgi:cell division protein FtsI/penicillin-binding protein 2